MVISREHFRDFQAVVEGYGIEAGAVDPGTGYRIIQDSDIADDVLWAIMVVNGANIEQKAQICDRLMPQIMAMSGITPITVIVHPKKNSPSVYAGLARVLVL